MPNDHESYSDLNQPEPQALPGENLRLNGFRTDIAPTGVVCPKCGSGFLEPARGIRGTIYKCTNEPECRYYLTDRPTGKMCVYKQKKGKVCGRLMIEGGEKTPPRCSDKTCPNSQPCRISFKKKD